MEFRYLWMLLNSACFELLNSEWRAHRTSIRYWRNRYNRAYMFCLQSEDGSIVKTFSGRGCAEEGLRFLPDNSMVFFHNLGYDVNFFARYGAHGTGILKGNHIAIITILYNYSMYSWETIMVIYYDYNVFKTHLIPLQVLMVFFTLKIIPLPKWTNN